MKKRMMGALAGLAVCGAMAGGASASPLGLPIDLGLPSVGVVKKLLPDLTIRGMKIGLAPGKTLVSKVLEIEFDAIVSSKLPKGSFVSVRVSCDGDDRTLHYDRQVDLDLGKVRLGHVKKVSKRGKAGITLSSTPASCEVIVGIATKIGKKVRRTATYCFIPTAKEPFAGTCGEAEAANAAG